MKNKNITCFLLIGCCLGSFCHAREYQFWLRQGEEQSLERDHLYYRFPRKLKDMLLRLGIAVVSGDGRSLALPRGDVCLYCATHHVPYTSLRTDTSLQTNSTHEIELRYPIIPAGEAAILFLPLSDKGRVTFCDASDRVEGQEARVRLLPSGFVRRTWHESEKKPVASYDVLFEDVDENEAFLFASIILSASSPTIFVTIQCLIASELGEERVQKIEDAYCEIVRKFLPPDDEEPLPNGTEGSPSPPHGSSAGVCRAPRLDQTGINLDIYNKLNFLYDCVQRFMRYFGGSVARISDLQQKVKHLSEKVDNLNARLAATGANTPRIPKRLPFGENPSEVETLTREEIEETQQMNAIREWCRHCGAEN